eukprot:301032-Chlamydomonas_euryale.AAC.1
MQTGGVHMQTGGVHMQTRGVHIQTGGVHMQTGGVHIQTGGVHMQTGGVHMQTGRLPGGCQVPAQLRGWDRPSRGKAAPQECQLDGSWGGEEPAPGHV